MSQLVLVLLLALAAAQGPKPDRVVLEAVVNAPVDAVWTAYTTKAGLESWMVPHADIDLKIGGMFRTNFEADGKLGDAQTIEHTILTYEPKRMLSLRVAKAPEGLPFKAAAQRLWSVVYFTPEGMKTRVTEVTMGFGADAESQQLRQFLESGNRMLLDRLQEKFAKPGASF